jgi:predicted DNA-binding transcriptional regulator AlpA
MALHPLKTFNEKVQKIEISQALLWHWVSKKTFPLYFDA